jgi:hypothetical protein
MRFGQAMPAIATPAEPLPPVISAFSALAWSELA